VISKKKMQHFEQLGDSFQPGWTYNQNNSRHVDKGREKLWWSGCEEGFGCAARGRKLLFWKRQLQLMMEKKWRTSPV
jgi:hypothetical protein